MFEKTECLPGRDSHMQPNLVNNGEISILFSARRCFASVHSNALKAPFASAKLRRKGTKPAAYFSHICSSATRNACSGAAAVIGPACRQVNDLSAFWSARFGLRRFLCLLLLEVTQEQLRKRDLHEASVSDRNHHFFMRLVRGGPSGSNGNNFGLFGHARS